MQISTEAALALARTDQWLPWALRSLRVALILGAAWVVTRVARRLLERLRGYAVRTMDRRGEADAIELEKRAATIIAVLAKLIGVAIWMIAAVMALTELTFNIQPLLAGLGVAGLALGLGAQTLIKDWIGGLLLLIEDQIRIGDAVIVNGIAGVVEEINLRTTMLRGENGAVHIISNGAIATLSNMTREYAYYVFEATLSRRTDVARALQIVEEAAQELAADPSFTQLLLAPAEMMGVERLAERGVLIRARVKTLPAKQAVTGREWNRRVNEKLAAAGIELPLPAA
ncbi:MAG: mechanosensitive ion channel family protein [Bryobacterales bacterium]|nr:mechanosensitive ion channel family protein [Bryobacterales bacterium]